MTMHVFYSGANRQVKEVHVYRNGANRMVKEAWIFRDGANRRFFAALLVSIPPVSGAGIGPGTFGQVTSQAAAPVITGGSGVYTYQWTHVSTSSGNTPTCLAPTTSNTQWQATVAETQPSVSTWKLTATDVVSGVIAEGTCTVTMTWTNNDPNP